MRGHRHSTIVPASVGPWIRAFATFAVLLSLPAFADPINGRDLPRFFGPRLA
jgi:hypothetical protein